jgi:hypothetical protein
VNWLGKGGTANSFLTGAALTGSAAGLSAVFIPAIFDLKRDRSSVLKLNTLLESGTGVGALPENPKVDCRVPKASRKPLGAVAADFSVVEDEEEDGEDVKGM